MTKAPKQTPQAQTAPPSVWYAAGAGTTMPSTAGSPIATAAAPATATATSASALPGPGIDFQIPVLLFFLFTLFHFPLSFAKQMTLERKDAGSHASANPKEGKS